MKQKTINPEGAGIERHATEARKGCDRDYWEFGWVAGPRGVQRRFVRNSHQRGARGTFKGYSDAVVAQFLEIHKTSIVSALKPLV